MIVECVYPFLDSVTGDNREKGERWEVDDSRASLLVGYGLAVVCAEQPAQPEKQTKKQPRKQKREAV